MKVLITGGCGFIGGAIVKRLLDRGDQILNLDKLTDAATSEALAAHTNTPNYRLVKGDICDGPLLLSLLEDFAPDALINCAAESHATPSMDGPAAFMTTNVTGTFTLLEAVRTWWQGRGDAFRFHQMSTDEVYGSLGASDPAFTEQHAFAPNSPYSASKAASDHLVRAWGETYGLPVLTTHCSTNYGPWQLPEKLIPLVTINAIESRTLPVHGTGRTIRDWIHVDDHAKAVEIVLNTGTPGQTYCIGGNSELTNLDVVRKICSVVDRKANSGGPRARLIRHVPDRAGHDLRYAVDSSKILRDLGWSPEVTFDQGLEATIEWYFENRTWWQDIRENRSAGTRLGRARAPESERTPQRDVAAAG